MLSKNNIQQGVHSVQWIQSQLQNSVLLCFRIGNEENGEFRLLNNH